MLSRLQTRLIGAQGRWARPFGDFNHRWLSALFRPLRPLKDFLNGSWLGHPLHAVLTDVPIGCFTLAIIFDVLDQRTAADIAIAFGILTMLAAAAAGLADYTDTDDHPRMVATVHGTLMVVALLVYLVSAALRLGTGSGGDRTAAVVLGLLAYLILATGATVGGDIVYTYGNMVNRHAWRFFGAGKWQALDITEIPEGVPVKAKAGAQTLVLVRQGETVHALHETCAHAGGPLSQGRVVDGCIECPWHGSRFDIATGYRKRGPSAFDQPRFEVRRTEAGGYEALRVTVGSGDLPPVVEH